MKGITTTGVGTASAAPDITLVEIGAEAIAGSASEARQAASVAAGRVVEALHSAGLSRADIQTTRLSIQPRHDYPSGSTPRLVGYVAANMVRATIRDMESAGATLDAALEAAGDAARLHGLRFAFSDPGRLETEARLKAVEVARANAETLARSAGVQLGAVVAISELSGASTPQPRALAMSLERASADTPIEAGETSVSVSVLVRFAIRP